MERSTDVTFIKILKRFEDGKKVFIEVTEIIL